VSKRNSNFVVLLIAAFFLSSSQNTKAQVSPAEIKNPRLKEAETAYFPQIMGLYRAVPRFRTPLPFELSRYVGLDPKQEAGADARGIEFVNFHNRMLLKVSGNYNAAYNPDLLTQNERAAHVFSEVISPIVALVAKEFPPNTKCDGFGFEISYHVRIHRNFDYEGKEILVVVFDRADAFAFAAATDDTGRQEILNRSDIYVNGKEFGLALNQQNPFDLEALGKGSTDPSQTSRASLRHAVTRGAQPALNPVPSKTTIEPSTTAVNTPPGVDRASAEEQSNSNISAVFKAAGDRPGPTAGDADRLQSQFQAQLAALASIGKTNWHFVDYAPPTFVVYQNELVLQITLRDTLQFSPDSSSIYRHAAQSFDLFLARELKGILSNVPADAPFDGYDFTVLNQLQANSESSSEAIEYVCSREALRQFVNAEITGQQLIDETVVLVNGVRIALNLQLVE